MATRRAAAGAALLLLLVAAAGATRLRGTDAPDPALLEHQVRFLCAHMILTTLLYPTVAVGARLGGR